MTTILEFYISEKKRKKTIKLFLPYFEESICENIENGCYDFAKQYCTNNNLELFYAVYKDTIDNILFNFEKKHNTIVEIMHDIKKSKFNPYNLAFLKPEEFDKDNWMRIILRKNNTEEKLNNLPTIEWRKCRECHNKKFFFYQLQTRSADEPITTFYICKECNKTYRINK